MRVNLYPQRIGRFGTDDGVAVVGNLADGRSEQHVASEQCHRELEIEFTLDLVQADHAVGRLVLLLEELLVFARLFRRGSRLFGFRLFLFLRSRPPAGTHRASRPADRSKTMIKRFSST